jgi:hypothetical protein
MAAPPALGQCLRWEPTITTLTGTLVTRTYPGPPNYDSLERGDLPQRTFLLVLDRTVCVHADSTNQQASEIRVVQLVTLDSYFVPILEHLLNRSVRVIGTLFPAHTAHHHTPVLITVHTVSQNR